MPLDATLAGPQSNSYLAITAAEEYFAGRLGAEAWEGANDIDKEKALISACRRLEALGLECDRRCATPKSPVAIAQRLSFPRRKDLDAGGGYIIPEPVRQAQCEEALALLAGGSQATKRQQLRAGGVVAFSVDGLSETYAPGTAPGPALLSPEAMSLVAPYRRRGGMIATSIYPRGEWSPGS